MLVFILFIGFVLIMQVADCGLVSASKCTLQHDNTCLIAKGVRPPEAQIIGIC